MQGKTLPFIFTVDAEPDQRQVTRTHEGWPGFLNLAEFMRAKRTQLEDVTGRPVRFTWFLRLDPQIESAFGSPDWVFKRHSDLLDALMADGDEIGIHVHCWRPARRWFKRVWIADYEDQGWAEHCVRMAHETYASHFGHGPAAITMGDHYMSPRLMELFDELGIRVDATLYPGRHSEKRLVETEKTRGMLPDFLGCPDRPFHPSVADFSRPGDPHRRVWEVPVSAGMVTHPVTGERFQSSLLLGIMKDSAEGILEQNLQRSAPYLHSVARTDVRMVPDNRERFDWAVDHLIKRAAELNLRFLTMSEFVDSLEEAPATA